MHEHHDPRGGFRNPWPNSTPPGPGALLRWWRDRLRQPPAAGSDPGDADPRSPAFERAALHPERLTVTWVGHATVLLQIGGLNVLTDPIWSLRASPLPWVGPKRVVPPGVAFDALPPIDIVLQSHDHYDHLDDLTVCRLEARDPGACWIVPLGVASFLRRRGVHRIVELDWWQETTVESLSIGCAPARHFSGRAPWRRNRTLWCGWSVAAASRRVLFAGDTGYHPEFARIAERFGPFDLALLPIGAYDPAWLMRPVHMNPEEAVAAARDLGVPRVVPMHWGTFQLTDEPMDEPPRRARGAWAAAGLPAERYWQLAPGETRELSPGEPR